jgi:hypothetical protein
MMNKLSLTIVVLLVMTLLLAACGGSGTTIKATTSEAPIPSDYITYTSEGLFSISYPSEWWLAQSVIAELEAIAQDILLSINSGVPLEQVSVIFLAGLPSGLRVKPYVNIIIESLSFPVSTLAEVVNAEIEGIKYHVDDYEELSRVNVTIDGREVTILDWEGTVPPEDKSRNLQMFIFVDNIVWIVLCTSPISEFNDWEEDFYNIINSFHYLKIITEI